MKGVISMAAMAAIISGCLGAAEVPTSADASDPMEARQSLPPAKIVVADLLNCETVMGLLFVDKAHTDPWLPPGFHARDTSQFLIHSPLFYGRTFAHVTATQCDTPDGPAHQVRAGFFVEAPEADGQEGADLEFFDVVLMGDDSPWTARLTSSLDWNISAHSIVVNGRAALGPVPLGPTPAGQAGVGAYHGVAAADQVFSWTGGAFAPQPFERPQIVRFWHRVDGGFGYAEYTVPTQSVLAGPTWACRIHEVTPLHAMLGRSHCGLTDDEVFDSITVVLPSRDLAASKLVTLPGLSFGNLAPDATFFPGNEQQPRD